MYSTNAGQHELVSFFFSTNSCASPHATISAPKAASTTLVKPN